MRAFRYPLAAALRLALQREQARRAELAALEAEARQAADRMAELRRRWHLVEHRFRQLVASCPSGLHGSASAGLLAACSAEAARLQELLARADAAYRALAQRRERARAALAEAARARKQLERHRALLAERHFREEMTREVKRLDEVATLRYLPGRASPGGAAGLEVPQ